MIVATANRMIDVSAASKRNHILDGKAEDQMIMLWQHGTTTRQRCGWPGRKITSVEHGAARRRFELARQGFQ